MPPPAASDPRHAAPDLLPQAASQADAPLPDTGPPVSLWNAGSGGTAAAAIQPSAPAAVKSPAELARDRRLSGGVFARVAGPIPQQESSAGAVAGWTGGESGGAAVPVTDRGEGEGALQALLKPRPAATVQARLLPTTRFLLPKGAFIDCTLETAIDSSLPGMTTCITAADTFGADGTVVLLERGSKLVGETRGQVQQGQARVFVVWTEVRSPTGVVVPLDSPGTDELGRAGLPGEVERHFWERFGAAMLISVVNGAVQAGVQAANHSGGAVIYAPSASQDVMTEVLRSTISIAPTVTKRNGDRIQVLVARDLDFRSVYELHAPPTGR